MGLFSAIGNIVGNIVLPGVGGSVLGAIGSEIDGDRASQQAKVANKDALKNQMELAKYTSGLEQENWQKRFDIQNAYNDPSAMRDRLENAGINPNMVYGSLSPNMAANPHSGTHSGALSAYQNAFDMSLRAKQQSLDEMRVSNERIVAESQAEKNRADADLSRVEAKRQGIKYDEEYWWHNFGGSDEDGNPTNEYLWQKQLMYGFGIKEKEWQGSHDTYINIPKAILDNYGQQNKHLQAQVRSLDGMLKIAGARLELDKVIGMAQARELYAMAAHYFALADRTQQMTVFDVGIAAQDLLNAVKDGRIKDYQLNNLIEDWKHAKMSNNFYEFDKVFNYMDRIADKVVDFRTLGVKKLDVKNRGRGSVEEVTRYDRDGNPTGSTISRRKPR